MSKRPMKLIGTSIYTDSVAPGFCDVFEAVPRTDASDYIDQLVALLRKHRVDVAFPGIDADMYKWADHVAELKATGTKVVLNSRALISMCSDKWAFYERQRELMPTYAIPSYLDMDFDALKANCGLPFLLKPRRGFGSKGIVVVETAEQLAKIAPATKTTLMAQPIVGRDDDEFTVSAFCDGQGGYSASMALQRRLSKDGFTEKAEVVDQAEFSEAVRDLCKAFSPIGPTNFQFRKTDAGLKLLEINPRISSSTSIRAAFGYNEALMAVDMAIEQRLPVQPDIKRGRAVRYTEDFIFHDNSVHL
ncbi:ATP-grasp domain-containing protein [Bradyrhizobium sp. WYCCWR 13023]|uniref:ATP-grasp domain-containing protein n=1 Tax=Bradyrhizobium zhengyangense TaxID=2911009 RepID=A0A9X1UBT4_9BRAD|nr:MULTISPECIES: ATP-grasp domain-containing protein [Bradyrhizobium]MCG2629684.1 ATP-grasp domain-containing protein [Bradyrhizobium zhengyangense]MCG2644015.1 ATP-grasp domain-containing protein [Bradyrhizobium zhengyangense]MCG2671205.1 ATP-grasp domain-containing protein [Bradyrhizobium zhengyangense]